MFLPQAARVDIVGRLRAALADVEVRLSLAFTRYSFVYCPLRVSPVLKKPISESRLKLATPVEIPAIPGRTR